MKIQTQYSIGSLSFFLWSASPFFSLAHWSLPLILYIVTIAITLKYNKTVSIVLFSLILGSLIIALAHVSNKSSLLNIATLVVGYCYAFSLGQFWGRYQLIDLAYLLRKSVSLSILIGFVLSTILSGPFALSNPLHALINGERLLILASTHVGHSVLNPLASIGLICSLLILKVEGRTWKQALFASVFSVLLILAGSSTAFLTLVIIFLVFGLETWHTRQTLYLILKNAMHVLLFVAIWVTITNKTTFNNVMLMIRQLAGQESYTYEYDPTAGRSLLTELLIKKANDYPVFGAGHDDPLLKLGVRAVTREEKGATVESPLRIAAKYGWPYFALNLIWWVSPIILGFIAKGPLRLFSLTYGYTVLVFCATNGSMGVAHSSTFSLLAPLIAVLTLLLQRISKFPKIFQASK
jgi:hypothetical protein